MQKVLSLFFLVLFSTQISAQKVPKVTLKKDYEAKQMIQVLPHFDIIVPRDNLAARFGTISALGIGLGYKTTQNVTFNSNFKTLFGNRVKENNMLNSLKGESGELIDVNGQYASVAFAMRGGYFNFKLGKIIRLEKNANNGLWLQGGFAYLQHRIKLEYQREVLPQLDGEMYKGYDRLTGGFGLIGSLGYHHITANNTISYYLNLDFGFHNTQSLRGYNYDQRSKDQAKRNDAFTGISFGIILPVRAMTANQESLYN